MKMYLGNTPIKGINVKHYEVSTSDATIKASDLQKGVTAYGKGRKIIGTGKSFEFAAYGELSSNDAVWIPNNINIIELSSTEHPIKLAMGFDDILKLNFSTQQNIASVTVNGVDYPLLVSIVSDMLTIVCDKTFALQVFYGKDNYV